MTRFLVFASLAVLLSGTAILRVSAEHRVAEERRALARLDRQEDQLKAEIDRLRFEVEVLESAPRLGELSADRLTLAPGSGDQMADGQVLRGVIEPGARAEVYP